MIQLFFIYLISDYLSDMIEVIMFLSVPTKEFSCLPLKALFSEILLSQIFSPLFEKLSDPDYVNSLAIWLVSFLHYYFIMHTDWFFQPIVVEALGVEFNLD